MNSHGHVIVSGRDRRRTHVGRYPAAACNFACSSASSGIVNNFVRRYKASTRWMVAAQAGSKASHIEPMAQPSAFLRHDGKT
jgi:hypothetical protein